MSGARIGGEKQEGKPCVIAVPGSPPVAAESPPVALELSFYKHGMNI